MPSLVICRVDRLDRAWAIEGQIDRCSEHGEIESIRVFSSSIDRYSTCTSKMLRIEDVILETVSPY